MFFSDGMEDPPDQDQQSDPGKRALRVAIAIPVGWLVLVVIIMSVLVAFKVRSENAKLIKTPEEAIERVTRITREAGGLTFGEFARARYGQEITCRGWDATDIGFFARDAYKRREDRYTMWIVHIQYQGTVPAACQRYQIGFIRAIAMVHPRTHAVSPPPQDSASASQVRPEWLEDFRAGRSTVAQPRPKPKLEYAGSRTEIKATVRLGERIRIPFGPVRATGGAVTYLGLSYQGPGIGPADYAMIRRSELERAPRIETGAPAPYPDQVEISYQEMAPEEDWYVFVIGTPQVRQTIRITEVTFQWSAGESLDPITTSIPVDITIVVA